MTPQMMPLGWVGICFFLFLLLAFLLSFSSSPLLFKEPPLPPLKHNSLKWLW